jgi:serine/threonine protein kinase
MAEEPDVASGDQGETHTESQSAGRRVGHYEIVRQIGRGGMATVYLARQQTLDREVALKELSSFHAGTPEMVQRFLRESRLAGALNHPNIVTVLEYFEDNALPYIAMEYVRRGSLRAYMGRLSFAQFVGVMEGVLAGLAHAETLGIVHRDLKPENLMVTVDGRVKITDFGIAKATQTVGTGVLLTAVGTTVGTPTYMAPEQAMGQDIGPWTDLYSVGIMAWENWVGHAPFHDSDVPLVILTRQLNEEIPSVVQLRPDVDPQLSAWIDRLLVKRSADRERSPVAVWDELEEIVIQKLGPRWRREARLPSPSEVARPAPPLTPAPFESQRALTPRPSAPTADDRGRSDSGYVTFGPAAQPETSLPPTAPPEPVASAAPPSRASDATDAADAAVVPPAFTGVGEHANAEIDVEAPEQPPPDAPSVPPAPEPSTTDDEYVTFGRTQAPAAPDTEAPIEPVTSEVPPVEPVLEPVAGPPSDPAGSSDGASAGLTLAPLDAPTSEKSPLHELPPEPAPAIDVPPEPEPVSVREPSSVEEPAPVKAATLGETTVDGAEGSEAAEHVPRRSRLSRGVLVGAGVLAGVAVAAAVGFVVAPRSSHSSAQSSPLRGSASAGDIAVSFPADWQRRTNAAVPGLTLGGQIALAPTKPLGGTLVIGTATTTDPSLLPQSLLSALTATPTREVVTLGRNHYQFYRYQRLSPRGATARESVYALPTTAGTVIGACVLPGVDSAFPGSCERIIGTLELHRAGALGLGPNKRVANALNTAIVRLDGAVKADGARLRSARKPGDQARAAKTLSADYDQAASAIMGLRPGPAVAAATAALARATAAIGRDYGSLSAAASRDDGHAYDAARGAIHRDAGAVTTSLAELHRFGYTVS